MHKLTHHFVSVIVNPRRYFDASSNLHLFDWSDPAGPNKYWVYRFTAQQKRQDRSLKVLQNISLSQPGGLKNSRVSITRLAMNALLFTFCRITKARAFSFVLL